MLRVLRLGITAGMLGALLITSAASAAQPTVFTIDIVFDDPGTPANEASETFHSDGSIICASGPAITDQDSLRIAVDAASTRTGTVGGWTILSGTGAYTSVRGSGQIVGIGDPGGGIDLQDHYTGRLTD